jgi:hypothetical protein
VAIKGICKQGHNFRNLGSSTLLKKSCDPWNRRTGLSVQGFWCSEHPRIYFLSLLMAVPQMTLFVALVLTCEHRMGE